MTNYFNAMPNAITIKANTEKQLLERIEEKEKYGWELVNDVKLGTREMAMADPVNRGRKYRRSYHSTTTFEVIMKRKIER